MPKLSIGIPVLMDRILARTADSLLTQTFREFEIVAASDPTPSAFSRSRYPHPGRVREYTDND